MQVLDCPQAMRAYCDQVRAKGARLGFVPTMGALHEGHLSLVDRVRAAGADFRCVSVFVNPTQFSPDEDLRAYPRTLEADCALCEARGVDAVFAPAPEAMYPAGSSTFVEVETLTRDWEGSFRPSHFRGVTTVVTKLLSVIGPCVAAFGRKDYQQYKVLARLARDLLLPVEIVGAPIVRDRDGLALSSRNRYLSTAERARALQISRGLRAAYDAHAAGERDVDRLSRQVRHQLESCCDQVDYVTAADPETLAPLSGAQEQAILLVAAHVGRTRLIDNLQLGHDSRP